MKPIELVISQIKAASHVSTLTLDVKLSLQADWPIGSPFLSQA